MRCNERRAFWSLAVAACAALMGQGCVPGGGGRAAAPRDVLPECHNLEVTALVEDCETVRLALGAAWDDALACRAVSGYLRPWKKDASQEQAEAVVRRGAALYERVKCVDDGIESVRLARDSRDEPRLQEQVRFWRNELALAARGVVVYASEAAALKGRIEKELADLARGRRIAAEVIDGRPWDDPQREAWRQAGPMAGVRLPLDPRPGSYADWWNHHLSLGPGYLVSKLRSAGDAFFSPETPIGAWGLNCTGKGQYDWTKLNAIVRLARDRGGKFLLELPTLNEAKTPEQVVALDEAARRNAWWILWPSGYAPSLPKHLASDAAASLIARNDDGSLRPHGSVQLLDPATANEYGAYLKEMAANLRREGLYDAIAAVHLEAGDSAELPECVDYSEHTRKRWQAFMAARYKEVAALNQAAGAEHRSFDEPQVPFRTLVPRAAGEWAAFTAKPGKKDAAAWGSFLMGKHKTLEAVRAALGDDYKDGYGWRLPFDYAPQAIKIDYLHFRRAWVREYLATKRRLAEAAFPDKLLIAEMRQFGDHDGVQGLGEKKWGGFLGDDHAQWSGVGPENAKQPFLIRSVGPPGFGTRPSDSLESLFRDYLWLNFRDPGNLARYFYHWVAHGYMDYQLGWHSVTNHWLTNRLLYRLGPTVANTAPLPQRVGLLMPRATLDLFDGPIYYSDMGWDWLLHAAKLPYTRVDEHLVRDGKLKDLKLDVLILPEVQAMDRAVAAEIGKWVAGGGLLLASEIPGRMGVGAGPRARPAQEGGQARGPAPTASPLASVLGVSPGGTASEAVKGTPLTVTIPHGHYSGRWAETTDRKPPFQVLAPTTAKVIATYESGKPAIALNAYGKGRAATMGYPFGREAVECERTSIGFQRTYVWFVREPQLVARAAWLRSFLTEQLGFRADYGVDFAEVGRFKGNEAIAPDLHVPRGLSQDPADPFFSRTVGDPRPDHELEVDHEAPDLALRFFPRGRDGLATRYLGISTREVHYLGPRATIHMILARHTYRCRINNPRIQALWDVGLSVPVGFERDERGVSFDVSLPSGHVMMLAISESPKVELFAPAPFPGRDKEELARACRRLAGGSAPPAVAILTPAAELRSWLAELAAPVPSPDGKGPTRKEAILISYGQEANKPAAEKLAAFLRDNFAIDASAIEQAVKRPDKPDAQVGKEYEKPVVLIGDEWTNNDMAMHGAYWGIAYGAHMPFTATYAWPGPGRAVVSLSRRYALIDENGRQPFAWTDAYRLRPVERRFPLVRRKLHIAANGPDASHAVAALVSMLEKEP